MIARIAELPAALKAACGGGDFQRSYVHEWERIARALVTGQPMPASVYDGRQAARIVDAALRSSEEGTVVSLAPTAKTGQEGMPRDA